MSEHQAPADRAHETANHTANPKRTQVETVNTAGQPRTTDEDTEETADTYTTDTETTAETPGQGHVTANTRDPERF